MVVLRCLVLQYLHHLGSISGSDSGGGGGGGCGSGSKLDQVAVYASFSGSVDKSALLKCMASDGCCLNGDILTANAEDAAAFTENVPDVGLSESTLNCDGDGARLELNQVQDWCAVSLTLVMY